MSMRSILKTILHTSIILMVGACSFRKDVPKNDTNQTATQSTNTALKSSLCADLDTIQVEDFQTLLSLSTSLNEEDLCTAISNFKRKQKNSTLLPSDVAIFNNILKSVATLAQAKNTEVRKHFFKDFSQWATDYAKDSDKSHQKAIIQFNNLISNSLINIHLIKSNFAESKIYVFAETDHLSQNEFLRYFDAISDKVTLANICSDAAITLALRSKKFNSHVISILEKCRTNISAQDIATNRFSLLSPVSEDEVQLLAAAIDNKVLPRTSEKSSRNSLLTTISVSVKRNDIGLFTMTTLAFKDSGLILYGLLLSQKVQYDLELFIKSNQRALAIALRNLWSSQEVVSALTAPEEGDTLFNLLSKYDIIPDAAQTEEILRGIAKVRNENLSTVNMAALEGFIRLLKSNTSTKMYNAFKLLNFEDEEINLIARGDGSLYIATLASAFSSPDRIYFQPSTINGPKFSKANRTNLYISSTLFIKIFFPKESIGSGEGQGIGVYTDDTNSFYITMNDAIKAPLEEIPSKIQWGPDYTLSVLKKTTLKDVPDEVKKRILSVTEYARKHYEISLDRAATDGQ